MVEERKEADVAREAAVPLELPAEVNSRELARSLIDRYFRTTAYPYTRHHIDSYDQFIQRDMINIIRTRNPVLMLKDRYEGTNQYKYEVRIYIGGKEGSEVEIGTPTVSLQNTADVRLLFPNEARLRNLTYASTVYANILVEIKYTYRDETGNLVTADISPPANSFENFPLFKMPIMLHSRYCLLHGKPQEFLRQAGECVHDNGGYFIVGGAEKVLITKQEQAFNTLYITPQPADPKIKHFATIACLDPKTRQVKRTTLTYMRRTDTIEIGLPMIRKSVPIFIMFRALGYQNDEEILRMIFPDFESPEAKMLMDKLQPSILDAHPFLNTYTAIQYMKTMTKGFSEAHVLQIIRNQLFCHMPNDPASQAAFLGDCVRKILRVNEGFDQRTSRDDTRNQRCLVSGFLIQMLFNTAYKKWIKNFDLTIGREYEWNKETLYVGERFQDIFDTVNGPRIFQQGLLTEFIMRGFKGKWDTGLGEEKTGVLQALSRLSYCDFMSHCRRVILEFDTNMKLVGPRQLHPSQYGYFCTHETPGGSSIGITKNMSIMTAFSIATELDGIQQWMRTRGRVYATNALTDEQRAAYVPVYVNGGIFGYTARALLLTKVLKLFKRTGCLPYSCSTVFSIQERRVLVYFDEGRPLRPLICVENATLPTQKLLRLGTWRDLVMGVLPGREGANLSTTSFFDPLSANPGAALENYVDALQPYTSPIEYIDPYEQNDAFIANFPHQIVPETTHMEVHPSTILSMMTSMIPFPHHNQAPRNQLSDSQSKQGVSMYATNWQNRFDNTAHVLCYGESQLCRTMYANYLGDGKMPYGQNIVLAIATWSGYNQEDGIVFNYDAFQRGLFRTIAYRTYEIYEEDDEMTNTKIRIGNPANIPMWKALKPGLDYTKLDDDGFIKVGEYCDENTVIVGAYRIDEMGNASDASLRPQVWTRGRVEKIVVTVDNKGYRLVKVRVVQDRIPELGDKFSNRHGQKGTIGAMLRGHDMPRTVNGIVPDMIMNPHAIPSRMTIAQNIEQLLGKATAMCGGVGDATAFMNDGSPEPEIGAILSKFGYERYGNEILYNGATGEQINAAIFIGPVYAMRLKHMVEDKWQARGKGRKEQMTHQPTGGRGQQGGLKIGEMDRDSLVAHSITGFHRESFMGRSDGATFPICTSCGTIPIYNPSLKIAICSLCDGPVKFVGDSVANLEMLPPTTKPKSKIVRVEMPYATKVLTQEIESFSNIGLRFITSGDVGRLEPFEMTAMAAPEGVERVKVLRPAPVLPTAVAEQLTPAEAEVIPVEVLEAANEAFRRAVGESEANKAAAAAAEAMAFEAQDAENAAAIASALSVVQAASGGAPRERTLAGLLPPRLLTGAPAGAGAGAVAGAGAGAGAMGSPINENLQAALAASLETGYGGGPIGAGAGAGAGAPRSQMGGAVMFPPAIPAGPAIIAVDTSPQAMAMEGLVPSLDGGGGGYVLRRARMGGGQSSIPGRVEYDEQGNRIELKASAPITVNKLG
jgi:DNA-directed RNA polymerase II subunit RPB2